jgi:hypothetical protein
MKGNTDKVRACVGRHKLPSNNNYIISCTVDMEVYFSVWPRMKFKKQWIKPLKKKRGCFI